MRVHHLAFRTGDLPRLCAFYAEVLGLSVTRRDDARAWLAADATVIMLERAEPSEPTIPPETLELVAFAVAAEARNSFRERLVAAGVAIEAETAHTLYFRDPDGRRVAVSSYPF